MQMMPAMGQRATSFSRAGCPKGQEKHRIFRQLSAKMPLLPAWLKADMREPGAEKRR
jgi:hypothetical protein